jgi:hypothetical protein
MDNTQPNVWHWKSLSRLPGEGWVFEMTAAALDERRRAGGSKVKAVISPVGWTVRETIDLAEWVAAGQNLGTMSRCSQWWLGDWIRYGNARFGERYVRAAKVTGYDVQSLMNMVWVASAFVISRRREKLSWSHHETLASLGEEEQERWLDVACERRLSVSDLRTELRAARARSTAEEAGELDPLDGGQGIAATDLGALRCPRCGSEVPIPEEILSREHG